MGCLSSKEKYKVSQEQEKVSGTLKRKQQQQIYSETQPRVYPGYPEKVFSQNDNIKKIATKQTNVESEIKNPNTKVSGDGLSSRNKFDRASQLRRSKSKKKRRQSNEGLVSEPANIILQGSPGQSEFNGDNYVTRSVMNNVASNYYNQRKANK